MTNELFAPIGALRTAVIVPEVAGASLGRRPIGHPVSSIEFVSRPRPVPARDRAAWRVTAALLALAACRGRSATVEQLHVLYAVLSDEHAAAQVAAAWANPGGHNVPIRFYDSDLTETLVLAMAATYVEQRANGAFRLTPSGLAVVEHVRSSGAFDREREFLDGLQPLNAAEMWRRLGLPEPGKKGR